jgi:hydrogenase expression/formation protein HypE
MPEEKILLAHGSGGKLSHQLVNEVFLPIFDNPILNQLDDRAAITVKGGNLAFSTDSFVVNPIFFPGGDIGKIAVCGTVNDVAMGGANPLYLSAGFIIEEGFPMEDLRKIVNSMKISADEAGVSIVTGDTKVVNRGAADKIFINTSGIGVVKRGVAVSGSNAKPGDKIIISGTLGDHGVAVMAKRQGLEIESDIKSDCAPLNHLVARILKVCKDVRVLRDPTRGGLATTLNEIALQSRVGIEIEESVIPVKDEVRGFCEILGLDPMYIANEGKLIAIVPAEKAEAVVKAMKKDKYGQDTTIIGEVVQEHPGKVYLQTIIGAKRMMDMLVGEQLPRIC